MVKRNSLMMIAILIGVSCITDNLQAQQGRGGRGGGGGGRGGGGMSHGGGMSSRGGGMSRGVSARSAGVSRGSIARSTGAARGGRYVNRVSGRDLAAGRAVSGGRYVNRVSGRDLAAGRAARGTVARPGAMGSTRAREAALVGGAAVGGAAVGTAAARAGTTGAGRTPLAGRTVPSNVVSATQRAQQSGQRIQGGRGEASAINRQARGLRAPAGGNTTQRNRPQSFNANGRRNYAFWRNGRNNIVSFRGGIPFLWYGGWWQPWPLFWNYWPWWYGAYSGGNYGTYDDCYDCDGYDCPDYCY